MLATSSVDELLSWLWGGGGIWPAVMDTLNTLLLGWLFSAVLILILAKFLYDKFLHGNEEEELAAATAAAAAGQVNKEHDSPPGVSTGDVPGKQSAPGKGEVRRLPTIVPKQELIRKGSASPAAGQDADAVRWINTVMKWLYRGPHNAVSGPYLSLLNDMTVQTALEVRGKFDLLKNR